jgi:ornithine cyclodeaminase
VLAAEQATELGAIVAGMAPGRRSRDDLTVCDLTGDTAIVVLALARLAA